MKRKAESEAGAASPPRLRKEIECPGAPRKKKRMSVRKIPHLALVPDVAVADDDDRAALAAVVRSLEDELNAAAAAESSDADLELHGRHDRSDASAVASPATVSAPASPPPTTPSCTPPCTPSLFRDKTPSPARTATPDTDSVPSTPSVPSAPPSPEGG
ncbi:hypothetical protein ACHHYP_14695 [Achlya hypogyna]|uniref:Uncharacterized protein n=1 Tax=Achlya hypogyna TaxID=1202772 RepID=A0A1V9YCK0_ACHHY|nr:hypothetical protein ACHHYP_14695 [Achlya hypogyna]